MQISKNLYAWSYRNQSWYVGLSYGYENFGDNFKVIRGHPEVKGQILIVGPIGTKVGM